MSHIVNYNKNTHDLYLYNADPIIDRQNPLNNTYEMPIGFNPNFWLNQDEFGFTAFNLDFTGVALRFRGGSRWQSENNAPNIVQFHGLSGFGFGQSNNAALMLDVFNNGLPIGNFSIVENYNFWNNIGIPAVLISPQHVLAGGHMFLSEAAFSVPEYDPNPWRGTTFAEFVFLGTNGVTYSRIGRLKIAFGSMLGFGPQPQLEETVEPFYTYNIFPELGLNEENFSLLAGDMHLIELDTPFTEEELQFVKIYKIINYASSQLSSNSSFTITFNPQSIITVRNANGTESFFDENLFDTTWSGVPFWGYENVDATGIISSQANISGFTPVYGDSLAVLLKYHPGLQELCFYKFINGDGRWTISRGSKNDPESAAYKESKIWNAVKNYIQQTCGYTITLIDNFTETDNIEIDGLVYTKGVTLSANAGIGGMTYFYGGLTSGNTYSFLVTARNAIGYSGYAGPTGFRTP
jgi:hypothetical protein